ncbi:hypothetical protein [Myxococcus sp. CA040A]|uniref:hypothetical protein n=1 Tax=Myxococcus sp. CA040A TaxID=2741738 RepID=UPI00157BA9BC|nr:hypothetical protein [Myxococcus sp. CA040A]NTX08743.1 hypothetical protein [Myxococcus sp. CA040A]
MAWHPRLVVRRGRGDVISSPSSHLGHGFQGFIGVVFFSALVAVAVHGAPLVLLASFIPGLFLRDAWAWFGATSQEREAYRAELAAVARAGGGLPPDQRVIVEGSTRASVWALGGFAGSLLLLKLTHHPLFLLGAMAAAAFGGAVLLDVIRHLKAVRRA